MVDARSVDGCLVLVQGAFPKLSELLSISGPIKTAARSQRGHVAEWLRSGLQIRVPRFNSGRGLHKSS